MGTPLKKKQHFIPQFYLRGFADKDGRLYAYHKDVGRILHTNVGDVCERRYLHEVASSTRDGMSGANRFVMPSHIEDGLGELEKRLAPGYAKFLKCCEKKTSSESDFSYGKSITCFLIAFLAERHPANLLERRESARRIAARYIKSGRLTDDEAKMMRDHGLDGELEAASEIFAMEQSLFSDDPSTPLNRLARSLFAMNMDIIKAPVGTGFVTSCAPFYYELYDTSSVAWLYFPLSWRYATVFYGMSQRTLFESCGPREVTDFNKALLGSQDLWKAALSKMELPLRLALGI